MRAIPVALVLALALPALAHAGGDPTPGWRVARLVTTGDAHPAKAFEAFDTASLVLADLDGDGRDEVVTLNDNNHAYVLDADHGRILSEIVTTHPGNDSWGARDINPISVSTLEPGGPPCLVIPNGAGYVSAWCYQGEGPLGRSFRFQERWEVDADLSRHQKDYWATHPWLTPGERPGLDGNAFVADVTGDGRPEIFLETDGAPGQMSFDANGTFRWGTSYWDGNGGAVVADLDHDGKKEAVFVSDAGVVSCYDARTGFLKWTFEAQKHGVSPGSIPVEPLVTDLDGDGKLEVVVAARQAVAGPGDWIDASHATWFALRSDGRVLWAASEDWMNPLSYNHPAALDVNGDGIKDVVALDWNTIGHKPGNWETTGRPSNLFALDGRTGKPLWHVPVQTDWSNKDFVVLGSSIVLDERRDGKEGLGVRSLKDGREQGFFALPAGWSAMRGPVAGDVDGDGRIDLVVPLARPDPTPNYRSLDVGHREGALLVVATGARGPAAFSADFLNSDAGWHARTQGILSRVVPAPGIPLIAGVVAGIALLRRRA